MVQDGGGGVWGVIALAYERRNGFSGFKGSSGTLSVVTERKAEVGTAMVGLEGLVRRGHPLFVSSLRKMPGSQQSVEKWGEGRWRGGVMESGVGAWTREPVQGFGQG